MRMRLAGVGLFLLLAACGGQQGNNVTATVETRETKNDAPFQLAPDGVAVASGGSAQHLAFSTSREATVPAVTAVLGEPTGQGTNPECGAGPLDNVNYKGGLTLFFQDGKFVGWNVDGRDGSPHRTAAGLGIGSTLQQLRDAGDVAVQDTSLGVEFAAGDLSGLVTVNRPEGKITNLWAGTTCAFR